MQLNKAKSGRAFKRIKMHKSKLKHSDGKGFTIGVHDGKREHKASGNGLKIYQLAAIQYNGVSSQHIPPRPWIITSYLLNHRKFRTSFAKEFRKYLNGQQGLTTTLQLVGTIRINADKAVFGSYHLLSNAPSTIRSKGKNNPLIESGELLEAITIECV